MAVNAIDKLQFLSFIVYYGGMDVITLSYQYWQQRTSHAVVLNDIMIYHNTFLTASFTGNLGELAP